MSAFVDTSAWFALANARDPDHVRVRTALEAYRGAFITSDYVFDELVTLVRARVGHAAAVQVGTHVQDPAVARMETVTAQDRQGAWDRFCARADKAYSFTDCTSFQVMDRLLIKTAFATDGDFAKEGFRVLP